MNDLELRDALARHAHALDARVPSITVDELDARPAPVARRTPRRPVVRIAVALTVVVAIVVAVAVFRGTPDRRSPARQPSGPDALQLSRYHWSEIPASPSPGRMDAATVWTGHEMIVWGGQTAGPNAAVSNVGTAYDPRTNTWRVIAASPLSARRDAASVWTGKRMFVWGGTGYFNEQVVADGALYDPRTNTWRALPPSPLSARFSAEAVWTGKVVLVVGGLARDAGGLPVGAVDAAAYDPARNAWHRLAAIPPQPAHPVQDTVALWIGDRLLVWRLWARYGPNGVNLSAPSGIDMYSYSPATDRWHAIPLRKNMARGVLDPVWTGHEVIVPPTAAWCACVGPQGTEPGYWYHPTMNRWRQLPPAPFEGVAGPAVWAGRALVFVNGTTTSPPDLFPGDGAAFDPPRDRWYRLARPPMPLSDGQRALVWTGRELLAPGDLEIANENGIGIGTRPSGGLRLGP